MAVRAARFAHCIAHRPVEYRPKSPFQPTVAAPLDFSVRVAELYTLDRELDRVALTPAEYGSRLGAVEARPGAAVALLGEEWGGRRPASLRSPESRREREVQRGQLFVRNRLRLMSETARFRPPWTVALLQDLHAGLFEGIDPGSAVGEFRRESFTALDHEGEPVFEAAPPDRIARDLDAVLVWVDRFGATYQPIVPAAVLAQAVYSIRPFLTGSTAVAETLELMFLRNHGLPNVTMIPLDTGRPSGGELGVQLALWAEATGSYTELVDHRLDVVLHGYAEATRRWVSEPEPTHRLEEVRLRLLARARRDGRWFSALEATRWVGARSSQTVLRHLNALVALGLLESLGRTRGKRYRYRRPPAAAADATVLPTRGLSRGRRGPTDPAVADPGAPPGSYRALG